MIFMDLPGDVAIVQMLNMTRWKLVDLRIEKIEHVDLQSQNVEHGPFKQFYARYCNDYVFMIYYRRLHDRYTMKIR